MVKKINFEKTRKGDKQWALMAIAAGYTVIDAENEWDYPREYFFENPEDGKLIREVSDEQEYWEAKDMHLGSYRLMEEDDTVVDHGLPADEGHPDSFDNSEEAPVTQARDMPTEEEVMDFMGEPPKGGKVPEAKARKILMAKELGYSNKQIMEKFHISNPTIARITAKTGAYKYLNN